MILLLKNLNGLIEMKVKIILKDDSGKIFQGEMNLDATDLPIKKAKSKSASAVTGTDGKISLTELVLQLRDNGFFKNPKSSKEVHAEVLKSYHCAPDRVTMALIRLHKKKELRNTTVQIDDKRITAYVW